MPRLVSLTTGRTLELAARNRVGRHVSNDLALLDPRVSEHHALVYWSGSVWCVKDLASTNGTQVNGRRQEPGQVRALRRADHVAFGTSEHTWRLEDDEPPEPSATALDTGETIHGSGGVLELPGTESNAQIFQLPDGSWRIEFEQTSAKILDNQVISCANREWTVMIPDVDPGTQPADRIDVLRATVCFRLTPDAEKVGIHLEQDGRVVDLGARAAFDLVYKLALERRRDEERGEPPERAGLVHQDALTAEHGWSPNLIYVQVCRARRFAVDAEVLNGGLLVERLDNSPYLRVRGAAIRLPGEAVTTP